MAYVKIGPFANGGAPALNATNMDKIDDGIYDAHQDIATLQTDVTAAEADIASLQTDLVDSSLGMFIVTDSTYGAEGDGVTDDTDAIQAAIDAAEAAGGGIVYFPPGTYLVSNTDTPDASWDNDVALWVQNDNIILMGAGRTLTKIRLADNSDCHVIKFGQRVTTLIEVSRCGVRDMEIDGNRANQAAPTASDDHWQGIDVATGCSEILLTNLYVHDCQYYAIGFQSGQSVNCAITHVRVENCGADGIDCKDTDGTNRGNSISHVFVSNFGLAAALTVQAGIDVRGGWDISDVWVTNFADDKTGVRLRAHSAATYAPRLRGFHIQPTSPGTTYGVWIHPGTGSVTDNAVVCDGEVVGAAVGIRAGYVQGLVHGCRLRNCTVGAELYNRNILETCSFENCTTGIDVEDDSNSISNCLIRGSTLGVNIQAAADYTLLNGGMMQNNTTNITDAGTDTGIYNVAGVRTWSTGSADIAVDATGLQIAIIAHGLDFTPDLKDCHVWMERVGSTEDYTIANVFTYSADATNVYAKAKVTVASGTGGATAKMRGEFKAKKATRW